MVQDTAMEAVQAHFEHVNWRATAGVCHVDDAFVWTCHVDGRTYTGPDGYAAYLDNWRRAFPDCWYEVQSFAVAGPVVVCQMTMRGTHRSLLETAFGLIAATGKPIDLPLCEIFRTCGGRLVAIESYFDLATLVRQLGRCPEYRLQPLQMSLMN